MSDDSRSSSSSMKITLNDMRESMEHTTDLTKEYFLPGVSGQPRTCPRVGDHYQALIPDMVEGNECSKPNAKEVSKGVNELVLALSIPIMWVPNKATDEENLKPLRGQADSYTEESNVVLNSENVQTKNVDRMTKEEKDLYPFPGTPDEPWNDLELDSFLLALYIFGKDLYLVKKIVETKKMNDVISYYYGQFYKCSKYQRWAKCLRSRSRKSIHGQRMFTGGRHQELFSRLSRHISVDTSNQLAEASKTFKEDGMSFEDYVFKLKDLVGKKLLIKVVAVGKGKQDLTGMSVEPLKLNRSITVQRDMQQDKGLSSLSCKEIIEQLTSSRLSKTKSNDLFWEAVWPRLLAGGWHSEQPKDQHHLVFLLPGVNRFKKTKHLKGKDYFDSVSDVLNRVASDPRMLELEDEKQKGKQNGYLNVCNAEQIRTEMESIQTLPVHNADISSSSSTCSGRDSSYEKSEEEVEKTQLTKSSKHGFDGELCVRIYSLMANGIRSSKKHKIDNADSKKRHETTYEEHIEQRIHLHYPVIDLNIPGVPDDVETNQEPFQQVHQVSDSCTEQKQSSAMYEEHIELKMSGRRQSTRNRSLTTKALEAIESSLIETKSKRKVIDGLSSRPSKRQRMTSVSNSTSDGVVGSNEMTLTTCTITEDESSSTKPGNFPSISHN